MQPLVIFLLAVFTGICIIGVTTILFWRPGLNLWIDAFVKRLMKDPYPENIGEMYNVFSKVGVQNVFESDLRATSGKPLQRPFGTPKHFSPWDQLLLNPVYFTRKPTVESVAIDTKVVIGPQAKRPLHIDMPITIAGIAYGFGLSVNAKVALAKGADLVNTVTCGGAGPFLPEERKHTKRLILQYTRGNWGKDEAVLRQADAIEIELGYGARGSAPVTHRYQDMSPEFRDYMDLKPNQDLVEEALMPEAKDGPELIKLVKYLREITNGAPIGIKFGATHYLEQELEIFTKAKIDFLSIAGSESGINYGPGILADDLGLPTLASVCRAAAFIKQKNLQGNISLIISGGLVTPGQFLKVLALGADAVAIGTIPVLAMSHTQVSKVLPWEPLTELIYENGKAKDKLNVEKAAKSVANFLKSCNEEIILAIRTLGWSSLKEVTVRDLCALTKEVADLTGAELGLFPGKGIANRE